MRMLKITSLKSITSFKLVSSTNQLQGNLKKKNEVVNLKNYKKERWWLRW